MLRHDSVVGVCCVPARWANVIAKRLSRLRVRQGHYGLLALDHGLTVGSGQGIPQHPISDLITACASEVSGVVLTYGLARSWGEYDAHGLALVLQCFGAPLGRPRVQISTLQQALTLDAAAVAVQIDLVHPDLSAQSREISSFVAEAHAFGMPVLYMASGLDPDEPEDIVKTIRICHEMGADLIKLPCTLKGLTARESSLIRELRHSPPVLIAGGPKNSEIESVALKAEEVGFSGYCIGRSIFESTDPLGVARALRSVFARSIRETDVT